ncbi:YybH family protein [Streptomyces sp. NPDC050988]|uniref:YybH family protein n=1 Tax=Streptomyces sp. NPDC050988 TaxID=3365637 RepID=UPI0037A3F3ED
MSNRRTLLRNSAAALGATALGAFVSAPAEARTRQQPRSSNARQHAEIVAVLRSYERALNASDVAGVVRLYTADAVLMAPNAPAAIGTDAVSAAYTGIFQAIDLDLAFEVAEVHVVSPEWAFLRSTSNGSVVVLANGAQIPSSNQELFVLQKCEGRWKLARYSFSSVLPSA